MTENQTTTTTTEQRQDLLATSRWEASGWDPWAELEARPEVELMWHDIADIAGGAAYMKVGTRRHFIVLSPALADDRARAEALTHELCHHQRGVVYPSATAETMDCEERVVRAMTRRRMAHYRPAVDSATS